MVVEVGLLRVLLLESFFCTRGEERFGMWYLVVMRVCWFVKRDSQFWGSMDAWMHGLDERLWDGRGGGGRIGVAILRLLGRVASLVCVSYVRCCCDGMW